MWGEIGEASGSACQFRFSLKLLRTHEKLESLCNRDKFADEAPKRKQDEET